MKDSDLRPQLAVLAVLVGIAVAHAWPTLWTAVDDAFISARYAEHLALGHGWTYNAAEPPVEGISNPLWTAWIALGLWLGHEAHAWMVGWGLVAYALAIPGSWLLSRAILEPAAGHSALIAPVGLALSPLVAVASTNGLETAAALAAMVWTGWAALVAQRRDAQLAAGLGLAALVAMRPEMWILAPGWMAIRRLRGQPLAPMLASWTVGVLMLLSWRAWTFGALVPNTATAKFGANGWAWIATGNGAYLWSYGLLWPAVGLAAIAAAAAAQRRAEAAVLLSLVFGLTLPVLLVELWMPGGRLLLPGSVLALVLLGTAARSRQGRIVALVLVSLPLLNRSGTVAQDAAHSALPGNGASQVGRWLRTHTPADDATLLIRDAGVLAYYAGPGWTVIETHENALTRARRNGRRQRLEGPRNPAVIALTQNREDATGVRYPNDQRAIDRTERPYLPLGRVYQHRHRYYDLWARSDLGLGPLPAEIVVDAAAAR